MYLVNYTALFPLLQKVTKTVDDKLLSYYQVSKREIPNVSTLQTPIQLVHFLECEFLAILPNIPAPLHKEPKSCTEGC